MARPDPPLPQGAREFPIKGRDEFTNGRSDEAQHILARTIGFALPARSRDGLDESRIETRYVGDLIVGTDMELDQVTRGGASRRAAMACRSRASRDAISAGSLRMTRFPRYPRPVGPQPCKGEVPRRPGAARSWPAPLAKRSHPGTVPPGQAFDVRIGRLGHVRSAGDLQ